MSKDNAQRVIQPWISWVVGAWCALLLLAAMAALYPGWHTVQSWLSLPLAPAWIQAVGAVAAIAVTGAVSASQLKAIRAEAEIARQRVIDERLRQALSIAVLAEDACHQAVSGLTSPDYVMVFSEELYDRLNLQGIQEAVNSIPMYELLSVEALEGLVALKRCLRQLDTTADRARRRQFGTAWLVFVDQLRELDDEVQRAVMKITGAVSRSQNRLLALRAR